MTGASGSVIVCVAESGRFFATRASARKIIAERIEALPLGEPLVLDWTGVEVVTNAFASELAAWLLRADRKIGSQGMNEEVRETYEKALRWLEAG